MQAPNPPIVSVGNFQSQGRTGIVVPDFGSIDAMPARPFTARQQEIDGGRRGASTSGRHFPERLDEVAPFRVGLEAQEPDDFVRSH